MASIGPVELQISMDNPSQGQALAQVGYAISATGVDVAAGRNYRELVELVHVGGLGEPGVEHLVPGGTMWDAPFMFTDNTVGFTHTRELRLPTASLEQGSVSPFEPNAIRARVTLAPLPPTTPTRESNTVNIHQEPVVDP
jgi:hypothetical protein